MKYLLIFIYIILIFANAWCYISGRKVALVTGSQCADKGRGVDFIAFISLILICVLMSGHQYTGTGDAGDFFYSWQTYTTGNALQNENFALYYMYFLTQWVGQHIGLSFFMWRFLMNAFSMILWSAISKKYNLDIHLFIFAFMSFYVFNFYTGLKYYYGACVFAYAYGFLFGKQKLYRLKFVFTALIAAGFHPMYYIYLIFTLCLTGGEWRNEHRKKFIYLLFIIAIVFSFGTYLLGSKVPYLTDIISTMEEDRVSKYAMESVSKIFIVAVFFHILCIFLTGTLKKQATELNVESILEYTDVHHTASLTAVLFYPFFLLNGVFRRLITAFSAIQILYSGCNDLYDLQSRRKIFSVTLFLVVSNLLYKLLKSGFLYTAIMPFFEINII